MADRVDKPLRGMGILSNDMLLENITDQGAGTTDSSFSERGPRPGQSIIADVDEKAEIVISGAQTTEIEVQVRRAGLPALDGLGVVVRRVDEQPDENAWRGRATPNFMNHWIAAVWSDVDDFDKFDLVVVPESQDLILLYTEDATASAKARAFTFPTVDETTNPQAAPTSTGAWGAEVVVSVADAAVSPDVTDDWDWITGVALPNGRVIAFVRGLASIINAYSSKDAGATWSPYSTPVNLSTLGASGSATANARARTVFYRDNIAMFTDDDVDDIAQIASNSLGTSFTPVVLAADGNLIGRSVCAVALPNNAGIVMGYIQTSGGIPVVRILSSAFQPYLDVTEIQVDAAIQITDMDMSVDGGGRIWIYGRVATLDPVRVWFSIDNGSTWDLVTATASAQNNLYLSHDSGARIVNFAAVHCRGWAVIAHNWVADVGNEDGSIGTVWSAGWGSLSTGGAVADDSITSRIGWGSSASASLTTDSQTGIPIELPADTSDWIHGGATAPTLESPGELEFAMVASTGFAELDPAGVAAVSHTVMVAMKITSGSVDDSALHAGISFRSANGVADRRVEARFNSSVAGGRIRFRDPVGGVNVGDISPWDVTEWTQLVVLVEGAGNLRVAYRRPWHTRWFDGPTVLLTDGGPLAATNRFRFGTETAATVTIRWRQWHHRIAGRNSAGLTLGVKTALPTQGAINIGGLLNALPSPIPEIGEAGRSAFISAQRGPGKRLSIFTIAPIHDFGIEQLLPTISPSPDTPWRSLDTTAEQKIVFDLGIDTRLGVIWEIVAGFFNTNVKTIEIDTKTAAAGAFTNVGTYNGAQNFEGLTYELTGDTIRPAGGTIDGGRFLNRNELRGGSGTPSSGFVILDTGGTPSAHRVLEQSAGGWTDPAVNTTLLPEMRLDGITGGEAASGLCDIVFPQGVLFIRPTGLTPTQYIRYIAIRIPAGTLSPDGFYQIGVAFLGTLALFGKQHSRGWSQEMQPNTSRRKSRYGTIRKRKDGPPARRWTMNWADGVNVRKIRAAGVNVAYLSTQAGRAALAAYQDVWGVLWAILEETGGGETPVLGLNSVPPGDDTISDRERIILATWNASVQFNQVVGNETAGPFGRIDPVTISELK